VASLDERKDEAYKRHQQEARMRAEARPGSHPWQNIPTAVLDDQRRAEAAKAWGDEQRRSLAADWLKLQLDDVQGMAAAYDVPWPPPQEGPYPGALPQPRPGGTRDPNAGFVYREPEPTDDLFKAQPEPDGFDWTQVQGSSGRSPEAFDLDLAEPDAGPLPLGKLTGYQGPAGAVPAQDEPRQDPFSPEMPFPGQNVGLRTPFGPASAPAGLPFQASKPVGPSDEEQRNVMAGKAPFEADRPDPFTEKILGELGGSDLDPSLTRAVGGMTRSVMRQGEGLPGTAEGMPGFRVTGDEAARARAFARGALETGGDLGALGRGARAAGGAGAAPPGGHPAPGGSVEGRLASIAAAPEGERQRSVADLIRSGGEYTAKKTAEETAAEKRTAEEAAEVLAPASPTWIDKVQAVRYGSMLSDWAARVVDVGTGLLHTAERPVEHVLAGYPKAAYEDVKGIVGGIPDAVAAFTHTLRTGDPRFETRREGAAAVRPFGGGPAGRVMSATTDFMAAADDFVKSINYNGALRAEAYKEARRTGGDAETVLANPPPRVLDRAERAAQIPTYSEDPGAIPRWLSEGRNLPGGAGLAVSFVIPFMRVGANIARRGVQRTARGLVVPGLAEAAWKLHKGDPEAARYALARTAIASGTAALFASEAVQGRLTDDGPDSPREREMLRAEGWRPNSWNVLGSGRYVDPAQLGEVGAQAIVIAHTVGAAKRAGKSGEDVFTPEAVGRILGGIAGGVGDISYLQGLHRIFTRGAPETVAQTATQFVPLGGAFNAAGRALDPLERSTERGDVLEAIQARAPLARQQLPARQDVLGRDVENPRSGADALNPLRGGKAKPTTVVRALVDLGLTIPDAPEKVTHGTLKNVPLTAAEQREYRRLAGEEISRVVQSRLDNPVWAEMTQAERAAQLRKDVEAARRATVVAVLERIGLDQIQQRIARTKEK
jgi:hypothetical protein